MANARFDLDESRFPLVVMTIQGELLDEDYEEMFSRFDQLNRLGKRYVMVTDIRGVTKVADAKRRKWIAERMKSMEETYGHLSAGSVMIIESALVRGSLTALQWLTGKKDREVWVGTMHAALYEAQKLALSAGLKIPIGGDRAGTA